MKHFFIVGLAFSMCFSLNAQVFDSTLVNNKAFVELNYSELSTVITALQTQIALLEAAVALNTDKVGITPAQSDAISENTLKVGYTEALVSANADVAANTAKEPGIANLADYLTVGSDILTISGANLMVNSGHADGTTGGTVNGLGNIIIGYDEDDGDTKTGSHNLVVGKDHTYSSYGGIVVGLNNSITGAYSSVSGGSFNTASGDYSSVSGGVNSTAWGVYSSVLGGSANTASGSYSTVSGGAINTASGQHSSILGGYGNTISSTNASGVGEPGNTWLGSEAAADDVD